MNINIIGTGSSGNSFLFDNKIMIDAGLSYKKLSEKANIENIKCILLTHIHEDHFNRTCLRKMAVETKAMFCCCDWLVDRLLEIGIKNNRIVVLQPNRVHKIMEYKISPFVAYHDVKNCGYRIVKDAHRHFHVTDTSTLKGLSAKDYDTATIECNHDIDAANNIISDCVSKKEYTHLKGAINSHLSVQEAIQFIKDNNIKKLYPVHVGGLTKAFVFDELKRNGLHED